MMKQDKEIIRNVRKLAAKECANWQDSFCVSADCPCHVIDTTYDSIHDGCLDCDWFVMAVLPLDLELQTAYWHEIFREEGTAGEGWKECPRCHKPFVPGSNRQQYCTDCARYIGKAKNRERQRRFRESQKIGSNVTL